MKTQKSIKRPWQNSVFFILGWESLVEKRKVYKYIEDILLKVAAQVPDSGCPGSGNFVKMVHNGIVYRDMQLIAEAYDITANNFGIKDDKYEGYLVDKVLDKTGMKGSGKWTIQQAAESSVAVQLQHLWIPDFSVDSKEFRLPDDILGDQRIDKAKLIEDVSHARGMNLIRTKSIEIRWELKLGELSRIQKEG
ncbi:hypothetical protein C4D60_Mb11t15820 [Musa balbisiana]|uniref:phosphogluconate dehydrogenase (NADP(+)-dependent, decarboxylating) n=1 Tax=Musa balbisiana TaxID=52838 RepID=A0A4S8J4E9_MUSBA|nr:hypothetical protein C4D60_Mb11t15820 [Musa balbisiana]